MCTATVGEWKDGGGSGGGLGGPLEQPPLPSALSPPLPAPRAGPRRASPPSFDISAFVLDVVLMVTGSLTPHLDSVFFYNKIQINVV